MQIVRANQSAKPEFLQNEIINAFLKVKNNEEVLLVPEMYQVGTIQESVGSIDSRFPENYIQAANVRANLKATLEEAVR